jgi:hypothetical protein
MTGQLISFRIGKKFKNNLEDICRVGGDARNGVLQDENTPGCSYDEPKFLTVYAKS